jgi:hypothetical protein
VARVVAAAAVVEAVVGPPSITFLPDRGNTAVAAADGIA